MGKITDALRRATQERIQRLEKIDKRVEAKYEFVAQKTVESNIDPRVIPFYDSRSPVTEQYRMLRTHLQALEMENKQLKTLVIASSTHSEGKTLTSVNLAISMAKDVNSNSILLVDADLRRATMGKYLGLKVEKGLADVLEHGLAVEEAAVSIGIENLTILPAGKFPHNPAELLGSQKMKNLLHQLRGRYDFIIFDVPPIIPVTDAAVLGAQADGVVMVIQAGRTQKGIVEHSEILLKQAHARLLGYVLTNVQYHIPQYIYRYL